jgi:hypothetical protein
MCRGRGLANDLMTGEFAETICSKIRPSCHGMSKGSKSFIREAELNVYENWKLLDQKLRSMPAKRQQYSDD